MKIHGMLKINNREYALRYGTNVLQTLEDVDGIYLDRLGDEVSIGTVSKLLYNGLRGLHPNLSRSQVGDLMDDYFEEGGDLQSLVKTIVLAINKSLGVKSPQNQEMSVGELQEANNMPR